MSEIEDFRGIEAAYAEHCRALYAVFGISVKVIERDERDYEELPGPPSNGLRLRGVLEGGAVLEAFEFARAPGPSGLMAPRPEGLGGWHVDLYRWEMVEDRHGVQLRLCPIATTSCWDQPRSAQVLIDTAQAAFRQAATRLSA